MVVCSERVAREDIHRTDDIKNCVTLRGEREDLVAGADNVGMASSGKGGRAKRVGSKIFEMKKAGSMLLPMRTRQSTGAMVLANECSKTERCCRRAAAHRSLRRNGKIRIRNG